MEIRYRFTAGILSGVFIFIRKIGIRSIKISILIRILSRVINKISMIVTIIKGNHIFLTDMIIYIIYIKKLHNFLK